MFAALAICSIIFVSGNAKQLTLEVRQEYRSPDCVERMVVTVNGQFPPPEIRAQPGELLEITVENHLASHALSVHWHGMLQAETPWQDGAAMVSGCSIGPGTSWVYRFNANSQPGTYMYHAHVGLLRAMGLSGPLIIEGDVNAAAQNFTEEFTMSLQDWWHMPGDMIATGYIRQLRRVVVPQSILINGKGEFDCFNNHVYTCTNASTCTSGAPANQKPWYFEDTFGYQEPCKMDRCPGRSEYTVQQGQTYLFRLLHAGAQEPVSLAFEGHNMTVIEADGMPTVPTEVRSLVVLPGSRFGVLVTMAAAPGKYAIRAAWADRPGAAPDSYALLAYADAPMDAAPDLAAVAAVQASDSGRLLEQQNGLRSARNMQVPSNDEVDRRFEVLKTVEEVPFGAHHHPGVLPNFENLTEAIGVGSARPESHCTLEEGLSARMMLGRQTFSPPSTPVLSKLFFGLGLEELAESRGYLEVRLGGVYDVVIQNYMLCPGICINHIWHLHGAHFWSLGSGEGMWTGSEEQWGSLNVEDPPMLDTVASVGCGWTFFRFRVENPGLFFLHCHQVFHQTLGAGLMFHTGPDGLPPPPENLLICGDMTAKQVYKATAESDGAFKARSCLGLLASALLLAAASAGPRAPTA